MTRLFEQLSRRAWMLGLVSAIAVAIPLTLGAQGSSLRAERTVDYKVGQAATLDAKVGSVNVQSVELTERSGRSGGFATRLTGGSESETTTVVRAHFLAENPTSEEWQVTFTLEFLDKSGTLIDRVSKKGSWDGEAKPLDLDHPLLNYVLPLISQVRVKMEAKHE